LGKGNASNTRINWAHSGPEERRTFTGAVGSISLNPLRRGKQGGSLKTRQPGQNFHTSSNKNANCWKQKTRDKNANKEWD